MADMNEVNHVIMGDYLGSVMVQVIKLAFKTSEFGGKEMQTSTCEAS